MPGVFVVLRLGVTEGLLGSGGFLTRTEKYKITLLLGQNYGEEKVHKRKCLHNINVTSDVAKCNGCPFSSTNLQCGNLGLQP